MKVIDAFKVSVVMVFVLGTGGWIGSVGAADIVEKKTQLEAVKSDLEDGLGLTLEQKNKIRTIREEFQTRQVSIKNALNAKHEALRQELDADVPVRVKVQPIVIEIKALQGQLTDNRVDVVFKLREIYTPQQIKIIKERLEQQRKAIGLKKKGKKGKKILIKRKK
jgi:Spy/CpxP family protein refolding chaperone